MDGTRAIVVALLLCLAPLGGISAGAIQDQGQEQDLDDATMSVASQDGTAEYLTPATDDIDRTGQHTTRTNVGGAVTANAGEVRSTFYRASLQRSYREADTTEQRREVVRNGTERLDDRVAALERRERTATEDYTENRIGQSELIGQLAIVDREARALEATVDWLETRASNVGLSDTEQELSLHRARLRPLQGPVREEAGDAIGGEDHSRAHVEVSDGGIVLATVEDTDGEPTYLREAHDPSARSTQFSERSGSGLSAAEERLRELYPWVTNNSTPTAAPFGPDYARLWRFTYSHPHGSLETYLDVETDRVVLERQYLDPDAVPTSTEGTVDGDLRLTLNTTRAGGPLGVAVTDATTGEAVDAEVTFDDERIGSTDGDRLWTVAPRGSVTVNATHDGETVTYETTVE